MSEKKYALDGMYYQGIWSRYLRGYSGCFRSLGVRFSIARNLFIFYFTFHVILFKLLASDLLVHE